MKLAGEIEILLVEWVKVDIHTESRPIISVDHSSTRAMDDFAIPAHKTHLEPQDGSIPALVGQNELDSIAVRHPHKPLAKDVLAYFVNGIIASKALPEVGVQSSFVSASATCSKAHWMEVGFRILRHEGECFSSKIVTCGVNRCSVIPRLQ